MGPEHVRLRIELQRAEKHPSAGKPHAAESKHFEKVARNVGIGDKNTKELLVVLDHLGVRSVTKDELLRFKELNEGEITPENVAGTLRERGNSEIKKIDAHPLHEIESKEVHDARAYVERNKLDETIETELRELGDTATASTEIKSRLINGYICLATVGFERISHRDAYSFGLMLETAMSNGKRSRDAFELAVVGHWLTPIGTEIFSKPLLPVEAKLFLRGIDVIGIDTQKPMAKTTILDSASFASDLNRKVESGLLSPLIGLKEEDPLLFQKTMETLPASQIPTLLDIASFTSDQLTSDEIAGYICEIIDRADESELHQTARVLLNEYSLTPIKHREGSKYFAAELALIGSPRLLPMFASEYQKAVANKNQELAVRLLYIIVQSTNHPESTADQKEIYLKNAIALLAGIVDMKDMPLLEALDIRIASAWEGSKYAAIYRELHSPELTERQYKEAALSAGIRIALEERDFETAKRLSAELNAKKPSDPDMQLLAGIAAGAQAAASQRLSMKDLFDIESSIYGGESNRALPDLLGRVLSTSEAELSLTYANREAKTSDKQNSSLAFVLAHIVQGTALTSKARGILDAMFKNKIVWSFLEAMIDAGNYAEVKSTVERILNKTREIDRTLAQPNIEKAVREIGLSIS